MVHFLIYAQTCKFGETGKDTWGFIYEGYILMKKRSGKGWKETFADPRRPIFPDRERYRSFRTRENAENWCRTHEAFVGGEKVRFIIREYHGEL